MQSFDLNVASPEEFPCVLRKAAQAFRESTSDLQSAWQDDNAGRVWSAFASILDRAAASADKAYAKYFL